MSSSPSPVYFNVPLEFDSNAIAQQERDYAHCLLSTVHRQMCRHRFDDHGLVRLKHDYLRQFIPSRRLPSIRNSLVRNGVLLCDFTAIRGVMSFGHCLAPGHVKIRTVECLNARLRGKILKRRKEARSRLLPVHDWLQAMSKRLTIDVHEVEIVLRNLAPKPQSPLTLEDYHDLIRGQVKRVLQKPSDLFVDKYGRVHTPLTSLAKEIRKIVQIDGESLVEFDLANSQPLFAGIICQAFETSSDRTRRRIKTKQFSASKPISYTTRWFRRPTRSSPRTTQTTNPTSTPSPTNTACISPPNTTKQGVSGFSKVPILDGCDAESYTRLCESGRLYESFETGALTREQFKEKLFQDVFFGKPCFQSPVRDEFRERFPTVDRILEALKSKDYERASWLMQYAESSVFIGAICQRIMRERPSTPVLTVHDSVLTTEASAAYVESVIREEFELLGVQPFLHRRAHQSGR